MKKPFLIQLLTLVLFSFHGSFAAEAINPGFTFQGLYEEGDTPFNGTIRLKFSLWDAEEDGNQIGSSQTLDDIGVVDGVFTVVLNASDEYGENAFNGEDRWLQVEECLDGECASSEIYSPRQGLRAIPYAYYAATSPWMGLTGVPEGFADGVDNTGDSLWEGEEAGPIHSANKVGIGSATPHHQLRIAGGPTWTTNGWAGALEMENAAALGWRPNAGSRSFGIGQSGGGLYFFHTFSEPGTASGEAIYDMVIGDSGHVGIGSTNASYPLTINTPIGYGWVQTDGIHEVGSYVNSQGGWLGTHSNHSLHFFTNDSLPLATLDTAGNFGVGTQTPSAKVHAKSSGQTAAIRAEGGGTNGTAIEIVSGAIRVPGAGANTPTPVFVHVATQANSSLCDNTGCYCQETTIDHPLTNGHPNAILLVTVNGNAGSGQPIIDHIRYDDTASKWVIRVHVSAYLSRWFCVGQKFNVLVVNP
ncbi:MAG: hypothetical protein H6751_04470 [Candidatus Omnitrophica bacterium]|nr:hypothetical protein [Candidatus Omnitrophota bacterium]